MLGICAASLVLYTAHLFRWSDNGGTKFNNARQNKTFWSGLSVLHQNLLILSQNRKKKSQIIQITIFTVRLRVMQRTV